jgi:hypothetical protein
MRSLALLIGAWLALLSHRPALAEEDLDSELAKKEQNLIADLRKLPFEYRARFDAGDSRDQVEHELQLKPVLPVSMGEDPYLVFRAIIPLTSKPASGGGRTNGLGDIDLQTFIAPWRKRPVVWGVGPSIYFPTATDESLGSGKWSIGPVAAVVARFDPWHLVLLAQNVWSFAGDSARAGVNQLTLQPKAHYNLPGAWAIGTEPTITADWTAPPGERWSVPLGVLVSKTTSFGGQHVTLSAGGYWYAVHPTGAGEWDLRAQVTFHFPEEARP